MSHYYLSEYLKINFTSCLCSAIVLLNVIVPCLTRIPSHIMFVALLTPSFSYRVKNGNPPPCFSSLTYRNTGLKVFPPLFYYYSIQILDLSFVYKFYPYSQTICTFFLQHSNPPPFTTHPLPLHHLLLTPLINNILLPE